MSLTCLVIVNQLNCRRLDRKLNVLEGFWRNWYFIIIFLISTYLSIYSWSVTKQLFT